MEKVRVLATQNNKAVLLSHFIMKLTGLLAITFVIISTISFGIGYYQAAYVFLFGTLYFVILFCATFIKTRNKDR